MFGYQMLKELNTKKYIIFDFETTGLTNNDDVIEYAFVEYEDNVCTKKLTSLVKPNKSIPYHISRITNIDDYMVRNKKTIEYHIDEIAEFINNKTLIAHNASFDLRFLDRMFRDSNQNINIDCIDSIKILKTKIPNLRSYSLDNLKLLFDINMDNHRAENDCYIVQKLLEIANKK